MGYSVMYQEHLLFENTKSKLFSQPKTRRYFRLVTENCGRILNASGDGAV